MKHLNLKYNVGITVLAVTMLNACESSPNIKSDHDQSFNINNYDTFTWIDNKPMISKSDDQISPLLEDRVTAALKSELESKGLVYVASEDQASFAVSYTIGSRQQIDVDRFAPRYYGGFGYDDYRLGYGFYDYNNFGSFYTDSSYSVDSYTEGSLAIDMFDVKTSKPAWHVVGKKRLSKQGVEGIDGANASEVVSQMLNDFPSRVAQ